ncbi:rhomboid-related protein 3 isoform X1, partial [Lates japonicus]
MTGGTRGAPVNSSPAVAARRGGRGDRAMKSLFDKYDPENSGFISTERFRDLLATHGSELDPHKLEVLLALADGNADGKICYQDFVNL